MGDPDYKALHARRPARADHNNWVHEQHQESHSQALTFTIFELIPGLTPISRKRDHERKQRAELQIQNLTLHATTRNGSSNSKPVKII